MIRRSAMKILIALAVAAIALSPAASAQTRVMTAHYETEAVLKCLLAHGQGCRNNFLARASVSATPWLNWTAQQDFEVGKLLSWKYAGSEPANAYTTRFLEGRTTDLYDVKFEKRELTFYITQPGPDGNVRSLMIRRGGPGDETADLWARRP
jgi:hypothetical protein